MNISRFLPALAGLALAALPASAADLAALDRTFVKEPAYRSKSPQYCLLAFGPEAKTRVWLALDGDVLYVDRNGNGDLTEADEKVPAEPSDGPDEGTYTFRAGDVREGKLLHRDLTVSVARIDYLEDESVKTLLAKDPRARGYSVGIDLEMPGHKGTGLGGRVRQHTFYLDVRGVLQFADRPQDAPVLHFGGPWQVTPFGTHTLTIGREADLILGVGTAGVGPGTTVYTDYEGVIPEGVHPVAEITYPPAKAGEPPARERHELKQRC